MIDDRRMFQNTVQAEKGSPLVTVITLVYNTGKYIIDTLDSIRNQSYKNIQHIIIDDCSKDDSPAIVEEWIRKNNWKCNFTRNSANKGICANLNYAIKELTAGKYVAIIGDDIMMPDKISGDVAFLEQHPDHMFCYSKMITLDLATGEESFPLYKESRNPFLDYMMTGKLVLPTPSLFYRGEVFEKVGYYDEKYICEDFDMIPKITYKYPVGYRDAYTIKYVVHPGSMTVSKINRLYNDMLGILKEKWSFHPRYAVFRDKRHLAMFFLLAKTEKKEAIKHLPNSLRFFFSRTFIKGMLVFLFSWPGRRKKQGKS